MEPNKTTSEYCVEQSNAHCAAHNSSILKYTQNVVPPPDMLLALDEQNCLPQLPLLYDYRGISMVSVECRVVLRAFVCCNVCNVYLYNIYVMYIVYSTDNYYVI